MLRSLADTGSRMNSRVIDLTARFKEHTNKITLADNFSKTTKHKKGNEYQKHDDTGRDQLIEGPAADLGDEVRRRSGRE